MGTEAIPQVLALIPARGGSKGIPKKNLYPVGGRPLISYSIQHALASRRINRTIVSTEDQDIARVAREFGAEVPFLRPAELAQDLSPDIVVFKHALEWLSREAGYFPDLVVHLRPTGPVRRVELIDHAIDAILNSPDADSLRSVSWPLQTPYKMWQIGQDGFMEPLLTVPGVRESHSMARQMLPEVFWQNGYVDVIRPVTILTQDSMSGRRVLPFIVHEPIYEIDYRESIPAVEEALLRIARGDSLEQQNDSVLRHPV